MEQGIIRPCNQSECHGDDKGSVSAQNGMPYSQLGPQSYKHITTTQRTDNLLQISLLLYLGKGEGVTDGYLVPCL